MSNAVQFMIYTFAHTIQKNLFDRIKMHGTFHFSDSAKAILSTALESHKCLANVCIPTLFQFFLSGGKSDIISRYFPL